MKKREHAKILHHLFLKKGLNTIFGLKNTKSKVIIKTSKILIEKLNLYYKNIIK
jgi:endonuclease III